MPPMPPSPSWGGGSGNQISGKADNSAIIAGKTNSITKGQDSLILGGIDNTIDSTSSSIAIIAGDNNNVTSANSSILGGSYNTVSGNFSTAIGGSQNKVSGSFSQIIGHKYGQVSGHYSTIIGAYGESYSPSHWNSINSHADVIVGGTGNKMDSLGELSNRYGFSGIFAGNDNKINGTAEQYNAIVGGQGNTISGGRSNAIIGSWGSQVSALLSGIFASHQTKISGDTQKSAAIACQDCEILEGHGGQLAVGWGAIVRHRGSVVFANTNDPYRLGYTKFASSDSAQFSARYPGGFKFCTDESNNGSNDSNCMLYKGGPGWELSSDRNSKTEIEDISPETEDYVISTLKDFPLSFWKYKISKDKKYRHLGPMAQDFYMAFSKPFKLSSESKTINTGDIQGVGLVAIKGLSRKVIELEKRNAELESELNSLKKDMAEMKAHLRKNHEY